MLNRPVELLTGNHIGRLGSVLVVFCSAVKTIETDFDALFLLLCFGLPPGVIEAIQAVEGFPPSFLLHQASEACVFDAVAVPDLLKCVSKIADGFSLLQFEWLKQRQGLLQLTLAE
jgi:hypothetical protein